MFVRGYLTTIPDNNAVPNGTSGDIRLDVDNSLVATVTTVGGWFEHSQNGFPGQFHITWNFTGVVREQYSKIVGPSGPVDVAGIPYTLRTLQDGIIEGIGSNMPVTGSGTGMTVSVGVGYAVVHGILYDQRTVQTLTITPAHATQGRLDRVVIEVVPAGVAGTTEGKSFLRVLTGTAAATPGLRNLIQTESLYQYPLATVTVPAAAPVVTSGNVAKVSAFAQPKIYPGTVTQPMLQGGFITTPWLADSAVTSVKLAGSAVTNTKIATGAVTQSKIADFNVSPGKLQGTWWGRQLSQTQLVVAAGSLATSPHADIHSMNSNFMQADVAYVVAIDGDLMVSASATASVRLDADVAGLGFSGHYYTEIPAGSRTLVTVHHEQILDVQPGSEIVICKLRLLRASGSIQMYAGKMRVTVRPVQAYTQPGYL